VRIFAGKSSSFQARTVLHFFVITIAVRDATARKSAWATRRGTTLHGTTPKNKMDYGCNVFR